MSLAKYLFGFAILSLGLVTVNAATVTNKKVSKIFAGYSHKGAFFSIDTGDDVNPNNCSAGLNDTFIIDPDLSDVGQVLSVLMAAKMADRSIDVEIYDDKCTQNHRVVRKIVLY